MPDTKERILIAALGLFARDGYEAVSVSAIAGSLGMTKSALYKHYANKRDIFDSIARRMAEHDAAQAAAHGVPGGTLQQMAEAYRGTRLTQIAAFAEAQFAYWTQDAFGACFRRLLTLEQYRDQEMARLFQQYLAAGPLAYAVDLFYGMTGDRERAKQLAIRFYAPMFLLYSVYDGAADKGAVTAMLRAHISDFMKEQRL